MFPATQFMHFNASYFPFFFVIKMFYIPVGKVLIVEMLSDKPMCTQFLHQMNLIRKVDVHCSEAWKSMSRIHLDESMVKIENHHMKRYSSLKSSEIFLAGIKILRTHWNVIWCTWLAWFNPLRPRGDIGRPLLLSTSFCLWSAFLFLKFKSNFHSTTFFTHSGTWGTIIYK